MPSYTKTFVRRIQIKVLLLTKLKVGSGSTVEVFRVVFVV